MNIWGYLGIDAGALGLSVIVTDERLKIIADGEASYAMVPGLRRRPSFPFRGPLSFS